MSIGEIIDIPIGHDLGVGGYLSKHWSPDKPPDVHWTWVERGEPVLMELPKVNGTPSRKSAN